MGGHAVVAVGYDDSMKIKNKAPGAYCTGFPASKQPFVFGNSVGVHANVDTVLHESGHGLYDQGLPSEHWGTPRGDFVSLGIHESQSRMWENLVGRGRAFWRFYFPKLKEAFPEALGDVSADQVWRILRSRGIQLQRRRSWCITTDPEFGPKAADVVALAGASGSTLGEITGYLAGYGGQGLAERSKRYEQVENWMRRFGDATVFVMAAIPNPLFDLAGLASGSLRFPIWRFLTAAFLGKIVKFSLITFLGVSTMHRIVPFFR